MSGIATSLALLNVACLEFSIAQANHGTTIVLCGNADTLFVGADSRMTKGNGEIVNELTCKIRRIDDSTFATLAGTSQDPILGINLLREAAKYGRLLPTCTMLQRAEQITDYLKRKLFPGVLANDARPHNELQIATIILFGHQNDTLQMVGIDFVWKSAKSTEITIQPAARICFTTPFPVRFYIADPAIWGLAKSDSVKRLSMLEQVRAIMNAAVTCDKDSGPPIDIVCVTKRSYRWIQRKPECEEQKMNRNN